MRRSRATSRSYPSILQARLQQRRRKPAVAVQSSPLPTKEPCSGSACNSFFAQVILLEMKIS